MRIAALPKQTTAPEINSTFLSFELVSKKTQESGRVPEAPRPKSDRPEARQLRVCLDG